MWSPIRFAFGDDAREVLHATVPPSFLGSLRSMGVDVDAEVRQPADTPAGLPWQEASLALSASAWQSAEFDLLGCDEQVWSQFQRWGCCRVELGDPSLSGRRLARVMWQIATRYQRFSSLGQKDAVPPLFWRALELHERLHDRSKPLVAADWEHALDTWRWTLRLEPKASLPLQLAALFHDVERLFSEPDVRVEQHASDYSGFKRAHAAAGGNIVADLMARIDAPPPLSRAVRALVIDHEAPNAVDGRDPATAVDAHTLAEADALSFFSLNASGFFKYYGPAHTARKVIYTLGRLGPRGRRTLRRVKLGLEMRALLDSVF